MDTNLVQNAKTVPRSHFLPLRSLLPSLILHFHSSIASLTTVSLEAFQGQDERLQTAIFDDNVMLKNTGVMVTDLLLHVVLPIPGRDPQYQL